MRVYQDSLPLALGPFGPKGNSNFEILLVKILNLKQILKATEEKIKFCLFKKTFILLQTITSSFV